MRKLTLSPISAPALEINGHTFEIKMSDIEIMSMANSVRKKYAALAEGEHDADEVLEAVQEVAGAIDRILGENATRAISEGKPVSIATAMNWLGEIAQAAMEEYADQVAEMHG